jgi:hypothetical protein
MCIFSVPPPDGLWQRLFARKVEVSMTKVFARMVAPGVQGLAYSMHLATARDVAMVLPLPVRPNVGEDAVRFVDLSGHPRMFEELAALFEGDALGLSDLELQPGRAPALAVHTVGSFIASYVPTRFDFDRLDRRFQMPRVIYDAVPRYKDHGFAVFQLAAGASAVHPMAFTFPTRELEQLFFPTVHLHDGRFRTAAHFDHALYYQHPRGLAHEGDAVTSGTPVSDYAGLADRVRPVARRVLRGKLANEDTWISTGLPSGVGP